MSGHKQSVGDTGFKLSFWKTMRVGFAFMGIMCFWEVYDYIMPLILNRVFGLNATAYGVIMGLDNLLAIFLLPFFGALSDRAVKAKHGRRTRFIFWGTLAAAVCLIALAFVEQVQYLKIAQSVVDPQILAEFGLDQTPYLEVIQKAAQGQTLTGGDLTLYNEYLSHLYEAQSAYAHSVMRENPWTLVAFIGVLLCLLVSMSSYRSPAVALMPDVTPKPLRSQANAIITLMGGAGGLVSILLYKFLAKNRYQSHIALFCTLAGVMIVTLIAYLLTVNEKKLVRIRMEDEEKYHVVDEEEASGNARLPKAKMVSLILILATVFLWFMGFNAVKTHLSVYATSVLNMEDSFVGTINLISSVGGAIALLPVALMAAKMGRKRTIVVGLALAVAALIPCAFMTANTPNVKVWFPLCFIVAGFGLVCVNVNTFPMATELSKGSNVGKYTGFYYISAMSAQAVTPFFAGLFMDYVAKQSVFVYGVIFILLSMVTICFTKHGDNKPPKKAKIIEYFGEED